MVLSSQWAAVLLFFLSSVASALDNAVVDLGYSKYRGQANSDGVVEWLGMRYAAPPVGPLRFSAPQNPESTEEVQSAAQHGPLCIPIGQYPIPDGTSEDCLFVEVYAPVQERNAPKLPVFVWIQAGGFNELTTPNYNGTGLIRAADMGIVVVTFNYRVGAHGFLAGEQVKGGGSLNNGLKDQIKALEWVQNHIGKFGGDPNHVVLGGASAGAASITLLLSAYGGRDDGLFHAAAAESQSFGNMRNTSQSQFSYDNLVIRTGCASDDDTLACLRNLDSADLQRENINTPLPEAQESPLYMYGPTIDDDLVPDYTYRLFQQGHFLKIPVIFGDVTNEGSVFAPKNISDVGEADTFIQDQFPEIELDHLAKINEWYLQENQTQNFPDAGPYWRPTSNAYGDMRYTCPGMAVSSIFAQTSTPNWNYQYAVQDPDMEKSGVGVPHMVDVNAIWGPDYVHAADIPTSYRGSNAPIIPVMQGYWTSFIKAFDPNTHRYPGSPEWGTWNRDRRLFIRTGETRMETVPKDQLERCEYLVSIGVDLGQ